MPWISYKTIYYCRTYCIQCLHTVFVLSWNSSHQPQLPLPSSFRSTSLGYIMLLTSRSHFDGIRTVFQITSKWLHLCPQKVPITSKFSVKDTSKWPDFPKLTSFEFKCCTLHFVAAATQQCLKSWHNPVSSGKVLPTTGETTTFATDSPRRTDIVRPLINQCNV